MATVTKTVRLDKEFVDLVEDYVKLVKEIFNFDITVNSVIAGSLVNGFGSQLNTFRIFKMSNLSISPSFDGEKLPTQEQIDKIKQFLDRFEDYSNACSLGLDTNEVSNE